MQPQEAVYFACEGTQLRVPRLFWTEMRCKQFKGKRKYTQPSEKKSLKVEENIPLYAMVIRESLGSLV
jgi:hypothetical protein